MTITSIGYQGTVDETIWATVAPLLGSRPSVVQGGSLSIVTGADRTVRVPDGTVFVGHGVVDTVDGNTDLQSATVSSGSRWDTVVVRRNWTTNATTLALVQGTSTKAIAPLTNITPGDLCDTPIALVKVTAGFTALQEVYDLRYWDTRIQWRIAVPPATDLDYGDGLITVAPPGTDLLDLQVRRGSTGTETLHGLLEPRTTNLSGSLATGMTAFASDTTPTLVKAGGKVWLEGAVKRSSGTFAAATEYTITTVATALAPPQRRIFLTNAGFTGSGVAARVLVYPTGRISLHLPYATDWFSLDGISWFPKGS